jgi:hypothetical protein
LIISVDDACGPRRLVKNNDLLYDLTQGCDLTHISWISWADWHRSREEISWKSFRSMLRQEDLISEDTTSPTESEADPPPIKTGFVVRFSAPVRKATILPDVITITVHAVEQPTGWLFSRRLPIVGFDFTPDGDVPPDTTNQFRVLTLSGWASDEASSTGFSWLTNYPFDVEIEIRGDLLIDCNGQAVDANAVGLRVEEPGPDKPKGPIRTGNGTPGGTFVSTFRVSPMPSPRRTR